MELKIYRHLPEGFLTCGPQQLDELLGGPCLIHLESPIKEARMVVSLMLHGNEFSGLQIVQELLQAYQGQALPRPMTILVGNVKAARTGKRVQADNLDYNRIWAGGPRPEHQWAQAVLAEIGRYPILASVDLHNNSGENPPYACLNALETQHINLAQLFGGPIVYYTRPHEVFGNAMRAYAPSVTLECGRPGSRRGRDMALAMLRSCLAGQLAPLENNQHPIYQIKAKIQVPEQYRIQFVAPAVHAAGASENVDLIFPADLDGHNFVPVQPGTVLGHCRDNSINVKIEGDQGEDLTQDYVMCDQARLVFKKSAIPAMLTTDPDIVFQDCLGYLMEEIKR